MSYTSPSLSLFDTDSLDVDYQIAAEQSGNVCGMIDDDKMVDCADFEDAAPIIPRAEWPDRIKSIDLNNGWLERLICKVKNQGREGSCVYNASAQAMEIAWNRQFGIENWTELSAISGYRENARGPSSGSSVPGALAWMTDHGLIPADSDANKAKMASGLFKCVHPNTGYYTKPASGWEETAKLFRVHEFLKLTSVEAWISALLHGYPCIGGRDYHCICHTRPMIQGSSVYSMYCNSWGPWNKEMQIATGIEKGFGLDSERKIDVMTSRGAWCIRTVMIPPWLEA